MRYVEGSGGVSDRPPVPEGANQNNKKGERMAVTRPAAAKPVGELEVIHERLTSTWNPEEIFGQLEGDSAEQLRAGKQVFRRLARATHPDGQHDGESRTLATEAFGRLTRLWDLAMMKITAGTYGAAAFNAITIKGRRHEYQLVDRVATGEIADIYRCTYNGSVGAFKLARRPKENNLLQSEFRLLRRVWEMSNAQWRPYLPEPIESFNCRQPGSGVMRHANVLGYFDGFYTLADVRRAYPSGVHAKDMAWMWRRLLVALGLAHQAEVIHGAVLPEHVLIHPEQHGLVLIDWAYAVQEGAPISVISPRYRKWYPTEVLEKKPSRPETDIAMAANVMLFVLGGDPAGRYVPDAIPRAMRSFFRACTLDAAGKRPDDAWALKDSFDDLLERMYGPRKFRPFVMQRKEN